MGGIGPGELQTLTCFSNVEADFQGVGVGRFQGRGDGVGVQDNFVGQPAARGVRPPSRPGVFLPEAANPFRIQQMDENGVVGGGRGQRLPDQGQVAAVQVVTQEADLVAKTGV